MVGVIEGSLGTDEVGEGLFCEQDFLKQIASMIADGKGRSQTAGWVDDPLSKSAEAQRALFKKLEKSNAGLKGGCKEKGVLEEF